MVVIKQELDTGSRSKGGGGGGGGGGSKKKGGGGGNTNNNNSSNHQKKTSCPSYIISNDRMMEILRCSPIELELLKHGVSKIVAKHPTIHNKQLRWELSDQEAEWAEMLSGERWEGEEYPGPAGFEKDIERVLMMMKGLATNKVNRERKKGSRQTGTSGRGRGTGGYGGGNGGRGGGGDGGDYDDNGSDRGGRNDDGDGSEGEFLMSGALGQSTPLPRQQAFPRTSFQKLVWMHKGSRPDNSNNTHLSRDDEDDDLHGSSPPAAIRLRRSDHPRQQTPSRKLFQKLDWLHKGVIFDAAHSSKKDGDGDLYGSAIQPRRPDFPRRLASMPTPTPASRHHHPSRMFVGDDDDPFVGVFGAATRRGGVLGEGRRGDRGMSKAGKNPRLYRPLF